MDRRDGGRGVPRLFPCKWRLVFHRGGFPSKHRGRFLLSGVLLSAEMAITNNKWVDQNYLGWSKRGAIFFSLGRGGGQRGDQIFSCRKRRYQNVFDAHSWLHIFLFFFRFPLFEPQNIFDAPPHFWLHSPPAINDERSLKANRLHLRIASWIVNPIQSFWLSNT